MRPARERLPGVPLIDSPFFDEIAADGQWDAETRRVAEALNRDGFAVIDFPEPELDALAADIAASLFADRPWDDWRAGKIEALERASDAWRDNASVRRIAANAEVAALLSRIYGRAAFPFQTLNFPIGSQQAAHIDLIHFASAPENFMCGVWVALEDVGPGAGPLIYYPGSHRWPVFYNEHIGRPAPFADRIGERVEMFDQVWGELRERCGVAPVEFHPRKGQALIWAAGLHHGGAPHTDRTRSRLSQVTHYFFADCAYWTPLLSNPFAGQIGFRRGLPDVRTGEPVENGINGVATPRAFLDVSAPPMSDARAAGADGLAARRGLARRALGRLRRMVTGWGAATDS
ncbi:phytanoyl-CoA dioxygenase family protein [Phenylobacterium sp.]|uniref:phytanoyl-CoA dioxygenase family protein n=1 Tax=Phenylobacterium sp. TaxID=1871053 RepID=UPI0025F0BA95|nr:phytanoyl-CoA dioxygenase family protein [Phenylobacterium sp.]